MSAAALLAISLAASVPARQEPTLPGSGEGLVTVDGERLAGALTEVDGGLRVEPRRGKAVDVPFEQVALVEREDGVVLTGEEYPVYLAFRAALWARHVEGLEPVFAAYERVRLMDDCRRLAEEARAHDADEKLLRRMEADLERRTQTTNDNADRQRARILEQDERPAREASAERARAAARWCAEHGLPLAASVLAADADLVVPDAEETLELAATLVPEAFPWRDGESARAWLAWARELLPASAAFVPPDDPLRRRAKGVWTRAWVLRTPNLVLFTLSDDPALVGPALRNGEGVVRVLAELLPFEELVAEHASSDDPLELRLHASRNDFLFESSPRGFYARQGVPGYYWAEGKHARFHVPSDAAPTDALGRGLAQVVAHELVHQYVGERWLGSGRQGRTGEPDRAGYWLVEGLARWLEDQPLELGLPERALDAPGTRSLVVAAHAAREDAGLSLASLLALSQEEALALPAGGGLHVALPDGRSTTLAPRALFPERAGALAHFLATGRGDEGRAAFVSALRAFVLHQDVPTSPADFGFEDAEALEQAFRDYLERAGSL